MSKNKREIHQQQWSSQLQQMEAEMFPLCSLLCLVWCHISDLAAALSKNSIFGEKLFQFNSFLIMLKQISEKDLFWYNLETCPSVDGWNQNQNKHFIKSWNKSISTVFLLEVEERLTTKLENNTLRTMNATLFQVVTGWYCCKCAYLCSKLRWKQT